jgi:hypothetical protein
MALPKYGRQKIGDQVTAINRKNKKEERLSFREIGILVYAFTTGAPISAERYQNFGMEGREAINSALRKLRKMGYIEMRNLRFNGHLVRANILTTKAINFLTSLGIYELTANPKMVVGLSVSQGIPHNMVGSKEVA